MDREVSPIPALYNPYIVNRLGTWNVRGINDTTKWEEAVDIFKKGKFQLLPLTDTKLKGKGEVSWSGVNAIFTSVQEMKIARERWPSLERCSAVVKFGSVSSRFSGINSSFQGLKLV